MKSFNTYALSGGLNYCFNNKHVNRNMHTAGLTAKYNISKTEMSVQTYKKQSNLQLRQ